MSTPPPSPATRTVRVAFGDGRGYDVVIGSGILRDARHRVAELVVGGRRATFLVADQGVPAQFASLFITRGAASATRGAASAWIPTEEAKSLSSVAMFLQAMAAARIERGCPVIALGGGITGDVAGFVASVYQRGTPWINCPTTLLAMVDASVGGKTGVNLRLEDQSTYKNFVGAFHQPALVMADVSTLASLPPRIFRAGLAECIKHSLLSADRGDPSLLDWTRSNLAEILQRDEGALVDLIARNIAVKAAVVAADERESGDGPGGGRMALNLGHTFAHAIETLSGLSLDANSTTGPLQHGEAVGLGLIAAATTAERAGLCAVGLASEITQVLTACGLPTRVAGLPVNSVLTERMGHDKKVQAGKLRLILPTERGRVAVVSDAPGSAIDAGWDAIRAR